MIFKKVLFWIFSFILSLNVDSNNSFFVFKEVNDDTNVVSQDIINYHNTDVVARLKINSINLDVPVLQYADNSYYLKHDEYGNDSSDGSVFLDYRNSIDEDKKILIFGHNSIKKDTEFSKLEKFTNSSFFNNISDKKMTLITPTKKINYVITSVLVVDSTSPHMQLKYDDITWKEHIDWINNNNIYDDKIGYDDSIVVLQTCYYNLEKSYLLVIAKLC